MPIVPFRRALLLILTILAVTQESRSQSLPEPRVAGDAKNSAVFRTIDRLQRLSSRSTIPTSTVLERKLTSAWDFEDPGTWEPNSEVLYRYEGDLLVESSEQAWDAATSAWEKRDRELRVYSEGRQVENRSEVWDPLSALYMPQFRSLTQYAPGSGGTSLPSSETNESWDGSAWVPTDRSVYTSSGTSIVSFEFQTWDGSAWQSSERDLYTEEGGDVVETSQEWVTGAWEDRSRTFYHGTTLAEMKAFAMRLQAALTVTSLSLILKDVPESTRYVADFGSWLEEGRSRKERDAQNQVITVTDGVHDGTNWVEGSRTVFGYGDGDRVSSVDNSHLDSGTWVSFTREEFTYDGDGMLQTSVWLINMFSDGTMVPWFRDDYQWGAGAPTDVEQSEIPSRVALNPAYPNPFNPGTMISYRLSFSGHASLSVFDGLGRRVASLVEGVVAAGEHTVRFDAGSLPSGVYFVALEAGGERTMRPVTLLR